MAWRANSQRPFVVNNGHIINFECVGNTCSYINYHCGTPVAMCLEIALLSLLVPCCYCSWVLALVIMQRCYTCCYCCYWPLNFCSESVTKANLNEWMNEWGKFLRTKIADENVAFCLWYARWRFSLFNFIYACMCAC